MTLARSDFPDWIRGMLLLGQDDEGHQVPVFVGDDGRIYTFLVGRDALDAPQIVKIDALGQLYTILRGADNIDVGVDGAGNLSAILQGTKIGDGLHPVAVDAAGQLIMVPRGSTGNYVAVNAAGFFTAVLKGGPDDALVTLSVDALGRIEAFALDAEDQWQKTLKTGNSELAARLGSPISYDWRGQTLDFNIFEHGYGCLYPTKSGNDAAISISPDYYLQGGYSLKMIGGSTADYWAKAQGIVGTSPTDRIGLTVAWSGYLGYDYVTFGLLVKKGATRYIGRLQYDPGSYTFKYQDSDGVYQSIATVYLTNYPYAFNFLKLVIDVDAGTYLRAMLNDTEYDLSAYAMDTDALGFSQAIEVEIQVLSTSGDNFGIYLDRYIVTVNEPE